MKTTFEQEDIKAIAEKVLEGKIYAVFCRGAVVGIVETV